MTTNQKKRHYTRLLHRFVFSADEQEVSKSLAELLQGPLLSATQRVLRRRMYMWRYLSATPRSVLGERQAKLLEANAGEFVKTYFESTLSRFREHSLPIPTVEFDLHAEKLAATALAEFQRAQLPRLFLVYHQIHNTLDQDEKFMYWQHHEADWICSKRTWTTEYRIASARLALRNALVSPPPEIVEMVASRPDITSWIEPILDWLNVPVAVEDLAPFILQLSNSNGVQVELVEPKTKDDVGKANSSVELEPRTTTVRVRSLPVKEKILQQFHGYVTKFDGDTAFAVVTDAEGRKADTQFSRARLTEKHIQVGDNFVYTISKVEDAVVSRFQRVSPSMPNSDYWVEMRKRLDSSLGSYGRRETHGC